MSAQMVCDCTQNVTRDGHAIKNQRAYLAIFAIITFVVCMLGVSINTSNQAFADTTDALADQGIAPAYASVGSRFSAGIETGDGSQISCGFLVTGVGTVSVAGDGYDGGKKAIDNSVSGSIVIPSTIDYDGARYTVTGIGSYAFGASSEGYACSNLTSVKLPSTLQTIGSLSFSYCTSLQSIEFPTALKSIGSRAFYFCVSLSSELNIPSSVTSIGNYAFCSCPEVKTVVFRGDVPELGEYAFSGANKISKVIFMGASVAPSSKLFNSENGDAPVYYYTIRFYNTKNDAENLQDLIASVTVSNKVSYSKLQDGFVGEIGTVPEWPTDTNIWRFDGNSNRNACVGASGYAYAEYSNYRDLSTSTITASDFDYEGEGIDEFLDLPQEVVDLEGGILEQGVDFTTTVQRYDGESWAETDDFVNPGQLRILIRGIGKYYYKTNSKIINIKFEEGITFSAVIDADNDLRCGFYINSLDSETMTGSITVAKKRMTIKQQQGDWYAATKIAYSGSFAIPETVELFGYTLTVDSIDSEAFTVQVTSNGKPLTVYCQFSKVSIPSTIKNIGSKAFANTALETVEFYGNLSDWDFSYNEFESCAKISNVVFYDKAPNQYKHPLYRIFASSSPHYYYTLTFYASYEDAMSVYGTEAEKAELAYETPASPIGQATVRDDLIMGLIPDKPSEYIWAGSIPDYPTEGMHSDSNSWWAPWWRYPEHKEDAEEALQTPLTDSTYAYADERMDGYVINNAFISGLKENYAYTGSPVASGATFTVVSGCGGSMKEGIDYVVSWEQYDDYECEWREVASPIDPGKYKAVIRGVGKYYNSTRYVEQEFTITGDEPKVDTTFKADVDVYGSDGTRTTTSCWFKVTSAGDGNREASLGRIEGSNAVAAISTDTEGEVYIPSKVYFRGNYYSVTQVATNAFLDCSKVTKISFPACMKSLSSYAFKGCSSLTDVNLPQSMNSIPMGLFEGCASLQSVDLPTGITSIESSAFSGCAALKNITLPSSLLTLGTKAFSGCANLELEQLPALVNSIGGKCFESCEKISSFTLTTAMTKISYALQGSCITDLTVQDGVDSIPSYAFYGATRLTNLNLSSSVTTICTGAFSLTAISSFDITGGITDINSNAFYDCSKLDTVRFLQEPCYVSMSGAFTGSTALKYVIFEKRGLTDKEKSTVFSGLSGISYYYPVTFYANDEAYSQRNAMATGYVKEGVKLYRLCSNNMSANVIYKNESPNLPDNCNLWGLPEGVTPADTVQQACVLIGRNVDLNDLSNAYLVTDSTYKYTGNTVNPLNDGSAYVMLADGTILTRNKHYSCNFYRMNEEGAWEENNIGLSSEGAIKITANAISGGGYTGSVSGDFVITKTPVGSSFTYSEDNGPDLTYMITTGATPSKTGTVALGNGVDTAVNQAYAGSVTIPEYVYDSAGYKYKVTSISDMAFYRCTKITTVSISSGVTSIGSKAFAYEALKNDTSTSSIKTIIFNNDLSYTYVATDAFLNCDRISTVVYMSSPGLFEARRSFDLHEGVTLIHYYAVNYYKDDIAARVGTSPEFVTVLKEDTYVDSPSPSNIYAGYEMPQEAPEGYAWINVSSGIDKKGKITSTTDMVLQEVVDNTIVAYVDNVDNADNKKSVACTFTILQEPEGDQLGKVAVGKLTDGKPAVSADIDGKIVIPQTVRSGSSTYEVVEVGAFAFGASETDQACTSITSVDLPYSVNAIGQGAFYNCEDLESADLSSTSVAEIGAFAYAECTNLSELYLPYTCSSIGQGAFRETSIEAAVIPSSVSTLGKQAFSGCSNLEELIFNGALTIGYEPITESGINQLNLTDSYDVAKTNISIVDDYVFADCPNLKNIVFLLNAGDVTISATAFSGSDGIEKVIYAGARAQDAGAYTNRNDESLPQIYCAVNYYASQADYGSSNRLGYICALIGQSPKVLHEFVVGPDTDEFENPDEIDNSDEDLGETEFDSSDDSSTDAGQNNDASNGVNDELNGNVANESNLGEDKGSSYLTETPTDTEESGNQEEIEVLPPIVLSYVEPVLDEYYEWSFPDNFEEALFDEVVVYEKKKTYNIDLESNDPSFVATCIVNGERSQVASVGDDVTIWVRNTGAVNVTDIAVVDAATGDVVAQCSSEELTFKMVGCNLQLQVLYDLPLTVEVVPMRGNSTDPIVLSMQDMEGLASANDDDAYYSVWEKGFDAAIVHASEYIDLEEFFASQNIKFDSGDSLLIESGSSGSSIVVTYDDLYSEPTYCYPAIGQDADEEPVEVRPSIAIKTVKTYADEPSSEAPSLGTTYSFLIGQTQREFNAYRDTSDSILDCVTKITLMCGPEPITDCAVEGLADSYYYTGDQICPDFVLTDTDGNVLQKDIDYTVTYGENEEAGTGTITVEGMGYYGKSMELEFNIVRLHELAGNDRVTTAAAIALNTYPQGSAGVIVASGSTAPDALSAAGLSGALGYPILLNTGTGLSTVTEQAIVALSDGVEDFEIIVMGGESAVSASAYNALSKYVQNEYYITRLDGQTRYETSAVAWLYGSSRGLWSDTAIVVTGTNYPDALSIAAYSAWSSSPILLCPGNELGSSVKNALQLGGFKHVVIVGGTGAVSDSAMSEAAAIVNDVIRLGGNTRYATNLKVAKWCLEQGMTLQGCAIATGQNFPDALAGASLLGKNGSVILLANDADTSALSLLGETDEDINEVFVFGKTSSVSQKVRGCALKLLGWS